MQSTHKNRYLLTPYFLDAPLPGLRDVALPGWRLNDPDLPATGQLPRMSVLHQRIAAFTQEAIAQGERPVSLAGDCCTTIGVLAGLQRAGVNPTLVWFDAHGDFNTPETTPSGFIGGMPLAMLVGRGEQSLLRAVGLVPLEEKHIILTDARDLDPGEKNLLRRSEVLHLTDIEKLCHTPLGDATLYVHFDTDLINPVEAPAMNYPAPGGPSAAVVEDVFRFLAQTGNICAVSMSSWNPELDTDQQTRRICMRLMAVLVQEDLST